MIMQDYKNVNTAQQPSVLAIVCLGFISGACLYAPVAVLWLR